MAKKSEKLYIVEIGYQEICMGTLPQCQRVQAALAACQLIDTAWLDTPGKKATERRVAVESDEGVVVKPCKHSAMSKEEFARESIRKIGMTPADQVKGGVV
tara:strand:+ start:564 stop:866 length:303 start_codon:yes stop_codon:yes gene_type:complete